MTEDILKYEKMQQRLRNNMRSATIMEITIMQHECDLEMARRFNKVRYENMIRLEKGGNI